MERGSRAAAFLPLPRMGWGRTLADEIETWLLPRGAEWAKAYRLVAHHTAASLTRFLARLVIGSPAAPISLPAAVCRLTQLMEGMRRIDIRQDKCTI